MTTLRMIEREKRRRKSSSKSKVSRDALRNIVKDANIEYGEKFNEVIKLNKRPRDESPIRCHNRCSICGRPRGVYRKFKLCRMCLRKAFAFGYIPGLRKASW